MVSDDHLPCIFTSFHLSRNTHKIFFLEQESYHININPLQIYATLSDLNSSRMKLEFLYQSIPDLSCAIWTLSKVIEADFNSRILRMVKIINRFLFYAREKL